ncbi:hypothetical protein P389DRAFT_100391 [Cystobasidium minutum MCA 4210]|uniref:uncharacterized protein n=1 Tax=Cystobasidium minutum MCA 4210 TaxID=1397322 RepID=UPI0034CD4C5A|eukprot:jgi/Rhomi1/100391/CE100390_2572
MQGYVQRRRVSLRPKREDIEPRGTLAEQEPEVLKFEMLIISRRSVERPGLRYQRRGVNQSGGVANFVETEYITSSYVGGKHHLTSYVQTRGSIPLFWSQSPWSLKPIPVLERDEADNQQALDKHFERLVKKYFGSVHIVNLAETTGKEGTVVAAYREGVARLKRPELKYHEWDFHHICKGMRYERISLLLDDLESEISHMSSFWLMDKENLAIQRGVMRVNCMDCLDRTNVVQSAFARKHVLTVLEHLGVHDLTLTSREALDVAFNELWANNGDAISREYAGTSALKGDFVRSGKRNWLGQFNDATNSVARYWQNTVLDFFKQAMIDYVLGINTNAFLEFSEKMQTSDPGEITRLAAIREAAIDSAASAVLADGEKKLYGWSLISPATCGQIRDQSFEEKILILTVKALYACSYEYTLQKVRDFTRIPLGQVVGIQQGEYILSALDPAARNLDENYGFCIRYLPEGVVERSRSYSIRNTVNGGPESKADDAVQDSVMLMAFKAVRKDLIRDLEHNASPTTVTSRVQVLDIVDHIRQACEDIGATSPEDESFVEDKPIISLSEAKAQVSFLDKLNYEVKKPISHQNMIWL